MPPYPLQRGFSFDNHDEDALQPNNGRPNYDYAQQYREEDPQFSPVESVTSPPFRGYTISPPSPPPHHNHPTISPIGSFHQQQAQRQYGAPPGDAGFRCTQPRVATSNLPQSYRQPTTAPVPPTRGSFTTPGVDNLGKTAAGGGITGLAIGVANTKERDSGLRALRAIDNWGRTGPGGASGPAERRFESDEDGPPYAPVHRRAAPSYSSSSSAVPLAGAAIAPALAAPSLNHLHSNLALDQQRSLSDNHSNGNGSFYSDHPYNQFQTSRDRLASGMAAIDPMEIEDDGDDGISHQEPKRKSLLALGRPQSRGNALPIAAAGAAGGAAAGGLLSSFGHRNDSGHYSSVPGGTVSRSSNSIEKHDSEWLTRQTRGKKRLRWIVGVIIGIVILAIIAGAVIGAILGTRHSNSTSHSQSAAEDDGKGDLSLTSPEIKALLNNPKLHKVFPGIDYTPLNAQYPACLHAPPSQNNVTRDMAVLSQLTSAVRLYGTDCNQTEMVLHALDRLNLQDTVKVWMGVWLGNNATTNARQLDAAYKLLDAHGAAGRFAGVIVGNEVLYRKDLSEAQLAAVLADVRANLTAKGMPDVPLATADLGDNWTPQLAREVDVVMSNIHPFFGGVPVGQAAGWTWSFWQNKDVPTTAGLQGKRHVIAETGWPSEGGNDCGTADGTCPDKTSGSVAGVMEMNRFIGDWVCQALANGTEYFWFEAFDEPWKIQFNTKNQNWEDKWGLLDVNRNLKPGVVIPDCGGKTV